MLVRRKKNSIVQPQTLMDGLDQPNIYPMKDGHAVARSSDFIIYSVESEFIEKVVAEYGPCMFRDLPPPCFLSYFIPLATRMNAVVAGQTSVKAPEKTAFEEHLPKDVHIVSCHSLHGPTVSSAGQPLVSSLLYYSPNVIKLKEKKTKR